MNIKIKGTVTPEIGLMVQGYDFDVRVVRTNVNLHFSNGHARTDLVAFKLSNNRYEVEVIDDPLYIFPESLEKGDLMNASEIANAMIRQTLSESDMLYSEVERKKKPCNVTGITPEDIGSTPHGDGSSSGEGCGEGGAVACASGLFVPFGMDYESILSELDFIPEEEDILEIDNHYFIPNQDGVAIVQAISKRDDPEFVALFDIISKGGDADRLRRAMKKSNSLNSKGVWIFDLDDYFDTVNRDLGTIRYDESDKSWTWAVGFNKSLKVNLSEIVKIITMASQKMSKLEIAKKLGKMY